MTFNYASITFLRKSADAGFWSYAEPIRRGGSNLFRLIGESHLAPSQTPADAMEGDKQPQPVRASQAVQKASRDAGRRREKNTPARPFAAAAAAAHT